MASSISTVKVNVKLPERVSKPLAEIAKLAGLKPESVLKLAIATQLWRDAQAQKDVFAAYKTWPEDLRAKLSMHDLRRMNGWRPKQANARIEPNRTR